MIKILNILSSMFQCFDTSESCIDTWLEVLTLKVGYHLYCMSIVNEKAKTSFFVLVFQKSVWMSNYKFDPLILSINYKYYYIFKLNFTTNIYQLLKNI